MLLTKEQERSLVIRIKQGDEQAREELIEHNIALVRSRARRFLDRGLDYDDLVQEGCIGLMKAIEYFDLERNCKFSTYAIWWIDQRIGRALHNQSRTIRLPEHVSVIVLKLRSAINVLRQKLHREPTKEELSEYTNIPAKEIPDLLKAAKTPFSLDVEVPGKDGGTDGTKIIDFIPSDFRGAEDNIAELEFMEAVQEVINTLPAPERETIIRRFGIGNDNSETLEAIAKDYGVTRERIRQREKAGLNRLKRGFRRRKLRELVMGY